MKTESQLRSAIRAARLKLRALAHGSAARARGWEEYVALQEELSRVPVKRVR